MKKMYEEGDDNMKRTIAEAWTKSQDKKGGKGGMDDLGGMGGMGGLGDLMWLLREKEYIFKVFMLNYIYFWTE